MGVMVHTVTESHCSASQVETSPSQVRIDVTSVVEEHFSIQVSTLQIFEKTNKGPTWLLQTVQTCQSYSSSGQIN